MRTSSIKPLNGSATQPPVLKYPMEAMLLVSVPGFSMLVASDRASTYSSLSVLDRCTIVTRCHALSSTPVEPSAFPIQVNAGDSYQNPTAGVEALKIGKTHVSTPIT